MTDYNFDVPDDVPLKVSLSIAPNEKAEYRYGICIYPWPHTILVDGFESLQDAYYWTLQTIGIDPFAGLPDRYRRPPMPPKKETDGLPLFEMTP